VIEAMRPHNPRTPNRGTGISCEPRARGHGGFKDIVLAWWNQYPSTSPTALQILATEFELHSAGSRVLGAAITGGREPRIHGGARDDKPASNADMRDFSVPQG
jgi:hypothetical protein